MAGGGAGAGESVNLEYTPTWVVALVCTVIVGISLFAERILHYAGKVCTSLVHPHAPLLVVLAIVFFDFGACPLCSDSLILLFFPSPVSAQEKPETSVSGLAQDQRRCQVHLLIKLLMNKVI